MSGIGNDRAKEVERGQVMEHWQPVSTAPRNGMPVILRIQDEEAPPAYPVTVGVWVADDITGRSYWRVFRGVFGTHYYFDQHIRGWMWLPLGRDA
jgi:hypothetical protein